MRIAFFLNVYEFLSIRMNDNVLFVDNDCDMKEDEHTFSFAIGQQNSPMNLRKNFIYQI